MVKWLAVRKCEEMGIEIYPGFAAAEMLVDRRATRSLGVRTGDMGIDGTTARTKPTFQPGMDIHAKVTVLGEGVRGTLSPSSCSTASTCTAENPQTFETGIKEIWRVKPEKHQPGRVDPRDAALPQIMLGFS